MFVSIPSLRLNSMKKRAGAWSQWSEVKPVYIEHEGLGSLAFKTRCCRQTMHLPRSSSCSPSHRPRHEARYRTVAEKTLGFAHHGKIMGASSHFLAETCLKWNGHCGSCTGVAAPAIFTLKHVTPIWTLLVRNGWEIGHHLKTVGLLH